MKRKEFFKILDKENINRLRVRIDIENGKMANFAVQYESLIDGKWMAIVRYHMEHGFFHRDVMTKRGEKIKTPIEITDLVSATIYAEQDIKDKWEFYRQRFLKGY